MKKRAGAGLGYFIDADKKEIYVELSDLIKYTKIFTKNAVEDFKCQRAEYINELLDYDANIDLRDEDELTKNMVKNIRKFGNEMTKRLDSMNKDLKEIAKAHKKNERKKRV